jgi:hypothetical protein
MSKMKLERSTRLAVMLSVGVALVAMLIHRELQTTPDCVEVLKQKASRAKQKMVVPNQDGGMFLLTDSDVPGLIQVLGFIGPKSLDRVVEDMENAGLVNVSMSLDKECVVESGLVYTLVSGSYEIPTPKSESL